MSDAVLTVCKGSPACPFKSDSERIKYLDEHGSCHLCTIETYDDGECTSRREVGTA